jgi:hypothetical protein
MLTQPSRPPRLLPFQGDNIPAFLKAQKRWAPWKALWKEEQQKYDKVPCRLDGFGLSTAQVQRWYSYESALAALHDVRHGFAGLGFNVTGCTDLIALDLDRCVSAQGIAPWALEVMETVASYTELSPSGTGLRAFVHGSVAQDWQNHERGLEVYAGHRPRFLTVSGHRLAQYNPAIVPIAPGVMQALAAQYRKSQPSAEVINLQQPDLGQALHRDELVDLDLPYAVTDFLCHGSHRGDRSAQVHASGVALYAAGLTDAQVFATLVDNPFSMEVALDHRGQDAERAMTYLWVEHCLKAKAKAANRLPSLQGLEAMAPDEGSSASETGTTQSGERAGRAARFAFEQAGQFAQGRPVRWAIKNVLPLAEVGAVFGESGSGKSFFVIDMLMAVALGQHWRGQKVQQGPVAYICAEGQAGFRLRLSAYAQHHGLDLQDIEFYVLGDAPNLLDKTDISDLLQAIRRMPVPPTLIAIDTLAQVTAGGNENSGEDMGRALAHLKALHKATQAMFLLVAHSGKDASRGIRGWSGIKGALDLEIFVERPEPERRMATITKMKDGSGEGDKFGFSLSLVKVGEDSEDGSDIVSCVLEQDSQACSAPPKLAKGVWQALLLRVLQDLSEIDGAPTSRQLIDSAISQLPQDPGSKDRRRDSLVRALAMLVASKRLTLVGGLVHVV